MKPLIKEIRLSKGLMQKFCAEQANISQQLWSAYEKGDKYPRIDKAYTIAKVLSVGIEKLYEVDEDEHND